jgi:CRISPR-associated protein Cas5t
MLGLRITVPVACFRKGFAREYWETEELPPPSTCYGFLLSLVGERDRRRHIGVRICPALLGPPDRSAVLRTLWRAKDRKEPLGAGTNARPDFQELLTGVRLAIWLDSSQEIGQGPNLEDRVNLALDHPERIDRFGGLSLGESTHMVDEVTRLTGQSRISVRVYLEDVAKRGRLSLPVWVDHVGSAGTRHASGNIEDVEIAAPPVERMPKIEPN